MNNTETYKIAIIGLAGRFPQAIDLEYFWTLLKNGREAVVEFSDEKLLATGIDPALLQHPDYVKSGMVIPGIADFDADFFEMSARDAEITDPQQRLFLECAWQVLEQAGYPPATTDASIGVYAGVSDNRYLSHCLEPNRETLLPTVGAYRLFTLSGKDYIATRTAYKLNLTGPAMSIQTACSTSLVAVHVACQSLLNMECDMVLAGGASIAVPQEQGYLYQEGMIMSPDGHCRAFDAQAQGTTGGGGVGVVLLKRLDDALADGDTIHAVIRGSAINNDGADKIGYTAPSVSGQSAVILEAQSVAEVHPDEISYIEAHGTGTPLGDPIEIQALTQAFRAKTQRKGYCAIGSVKTNIGHADAAAGIAGLIKTILALKHQKLPPSLHYERPNPQIDFANSPFFVNHQLVDWKADEATPRCAGVSSFGVGGTNAHVIVEEAPALESSGPSRPLQLITLSAKTPTALESATHNLSDWLQSHEEIALADVAYTLNQGRQSFAYRRSLVCSDINDALQQLGNPAGLAISKASEKARTVVFLFPGQGSQYLNMTRNLYASESVFKNAFDECTTLLTPSLGLNLRDLLYSDNEQHHATLKQTAYTQPALFAVEYALAKLWMAYGVQPRAMLGHSIGEYVAACLAGVFSLEEALVLVATRGQLIQSLPSGAMLAVPLSEEEIQPWMTTEVSLAAVNGSKRCVVSGTHQAMASLQQALQAQGIESRALQTSHAFHSHLLEPILASFSQKVGQMKLRPPKIPYLSNFTGDWIRSEQATDPQYWVSHLRHTVRFADNVQTLFKHQTDILLEVGPGQTLLAMMRQEPEYSDRAVLVASLPRQRDTENQAEITQFLHTLGQLWSQGVDDIHWPAFYADEKRHRLPLPTYPFERQRYWIDAPKRQVHQATGKSRVQSKDNNTDSKHWLYRPDWIKSAISNTTAVGTKAQHWVLFEDHCGVSQQLQQALLQQGHTVTTVQVNTTFKQQTANAYCINPQQVEDYESLVRTLAQTEFPSQWLHCWMISQEPSDNPFEQSELALQLGFYSLLYLTQALGKCNINKPLDITVLSNQMQAVIDSDPVQPEKATLLGAVKTIGQEANNLHCRSIDITIPFDNEPQIQSLLLELLTPINESVIAYRQGQRWTQNYQSVRWQSSLPTHRLRQQGTYLITGGLGGIGLSLADYLAHHVQAKLILIGRSAFPAKMAWQNYLSEHEKTDAIVQKIHRLQKLEKEGAEVLVYNADVADRRQMQEVIESSQQHFGEIHGVIHAAGIPDGALIANRDSQTSAQVLAPKVTGTLVLNQLLSEQPLDFFVLCSSLASIVGIAGQVAYCAANAFQDAFAQAQRHHPQTLFTAINWDTWQKVGMAVKAVNNPLAVAPGRNLAESPLKTAHPLFYAYQRDGHKITYLSQLNEQLWVLNDHRLFGSQSTVMPGTAYLEWAGAALLQHRTETNLSTSTVVLQDVYFLQPLVIENNTTKTLYTTLIPKGNGKETTYEFIISSQTDRHKQEHARGWIKASSAKPSLDYSLKQIRHDCQKEVITVTPSLIQNNVPKSNALERALNLFGQHWHNLKQVYLGDKQGLAYLELPTPLLDDLNEYSLHPGLLDMATGFMGMSNALGDKPTLPFYYQSITVYAPLPARFYSYARLSKSHDTTQDDSVLDIILLDEQGIPLVEIIGYTLRQIEERTVAYQQLFSNTAENFQLSIGTKGDLESLSLLPAERIPPSDNEIEIEVFAVGLNFKEVLYAMDMLQMPDDFRFGLECAGCVSRVGHQVTSFKTGDKVVAFATGSLSRFTNVDSGSVALQPSFLEATEAATIPVAYVTAYYALLSLGQLKKGERVLIHAATGGVGMAAVRIAQWVGAEIFATAGNSKKREYLRSLGIQYVMDSRSGDFAEQIMRYTQNEGVNVVLNSLSGELMLKNFEILAPFGRFLEMGVRDIYNNTLLGLKSFVQGQTYSAIQLGPDSPGFQKAFRAVLQAIENKELSALPLHVYPLNEISQAFEYMARARHIGKVVISIQENPEAQADIHAAKMLSHGLLPEEGMAVFEQVLHHQQAQILVAKQGLPALFEPVKNWFESQVTEEKELVAKPRPMSAQTYIAPRTEIEEKLVAIWQKFLGIAPIGVEDDFFEFGGDSLLAVQLTTYVRTQLQVELSTQALLNAPTIANFVKLLKHAETQNTPGSDEPKLLVEIKSGNPQHPSLVMIHPVGGHVFFYRELAQQLESEQPVYGIQAQGVDGKSTPLDQIEAMATQYIRQLQKHQPTGPYLLGGSSFGGMIAYEMAQQLKQQGEDIGLLVLIDTPGPEHMPTGHLNEDVEVMAYILEVGNGIRISVDELRQMDEQTRWAWFVEKTGGDETESSQMQSQIFMDLFRANMQAMFAYQPQPWEGDAIFFRAMEQDAYNAKTPEKAWEPLIRGNLTIYSIPGNHITMNEQPHVKVLADYLQRAINSAMVLTESKTT
jgi:acyl transferase domain-containing protein/thioesterase domain-containing protein/D-arabinose 1-dehydrogenase-like Zn-dependent alcohol dehydrogenase/acyl carrier protein